MSYNLPPGVTESMIPGNRPKDAAWERCWQQAEDELIEEQGVEEPTKRDIERRAEVLMERLADSGQY